MWNLPPLSPTSGLPEQDRRDLMSLVSWERAHSSYLGVATAAAVLGAGTGILRAPAQTRVWVAVGMVALFAVLFAVRTLVRKARREGVERARTKWGPGGAGPLPTHQF
ncbi:hypothetical protein GCM10010193_19910 [Kitasatospora atroaurantiaca]|uniref:Uncharacterized protein n=1 Tax=Kitasatospora atroaurantiaca TaxID=285545 RepID=A0A561EPR8_9ACTN|nr:hypothetical protein [Kitasatospora atroaurantiaca]TWE17579.1 hypothetical protein FB465_2614 [Kitasatospora atroaurantiaca]